ncbi:MAG: hypothetical protein QOK39_2154 [Acidimicrobiaceae bacterium]|nr:hypothetical protein [Acidimicrobiaceae bacterium]
MSLVERLSLGLARTDRRGFLTRAAVVGSALAVNPVEYVLKPMSALAAVCSCVGSGCSCGSACCDGYTEFCCTLSGRNACPPGTSAAGWWKVDGSTFCGNGPRYYIDCNAHCGGCGCGSSGVCSGSCSGTACTCAGNQCSHRRTGCTQFRYGQCNQQISCLGPIVCRVVTCLPPWQVDTTCGMTPATDSSTAGHDASCLHTPVGSLDAATSLPSGLHLVGWALDPDTDASITVHIYIDGNFVTSVAANTARPDIAAAFPGYGGAHGFDTLVPSLGSGTHQVCAYGINALVGAGNSNNPLLGCLAVAVGVPFGFVDSTVRIPGGVRVTGWAIDPQTTDPVAVQVQVDGAVAATGTANVVRPDVGAAFPASGSAHGYDFTVPVPDGQHKICVLAVKGSANPTLGCVTMTLAANPVGFVDVMRVVPGGARIAGWAVDPDTGNPVTVSVVVDGTPITSFPADQPRPDIANAFPGYGPNHGFDMTVSVAAGKRSICVVASNQGPGTANPTLACNTLMVGGNPFGFIDAIGAAAGGVRAQGWVIDPDIAGPVTVQVLVDGKIVASAPADGARPDIAAAFPPYGPNHGFDVTAPISSGTHNVCVVALNSGAGTANPQLGCRTVTVP